MSPNEKKHLRFAIVEAIYMSLENHEGEDTQTKKLISELFELNGGGPVGRASPDAQNIYHYAGQLADSVERSIEMGEEIAF